MTRTGALRSASLGWVAAVLALCLVLSGCQASSRATPSSQPIPSSTMEPRLPYIRLVDTAAARGLRVWIEVDLVKAWEESPQRYADVLNVAIALASRKGVDGIKIADELGYRDGLADPAEVRDFLLTSSQEIHGRLPHTKMLVDMTVPQLGCIAWAAHSDQRDDCDTAAANNTPASSIDAVDSYLALGAIDVMDLSVGLRDEQVYAKWGTTRDAAMAEIWREVARRRWSSLVHLQARKALAHSGTYEGTAADAERDVHTFVDLPLAGGASAVDIWTWSQSYEGEVYQLTDDSLRPNALTEALARRRAKGDQLWTHMTPSSMQVSPESDVKAASGLFRAVFVAGGTG